MASRSTIWSANRIVDIASAPFRGRMAARYWLLRMTTVPTPMRPSDSMASSNNGYAWVAASPSGDSQNVLS